MVSIRLIVCEGRDTIQVSSVSKYISVSVTYRYSQNFTGGADLRDCE